MEVYLEYAIIDNLIMDYLLLKGTAKLTKTRSTFFRLSLGAIVGTIIAVIIPIFNLNDGLAFLIKIILAMLITLISCEHKSVFNYLKFLNVFILLTFAVGGMIIGVLSLLGIDYSTEGVKNAGVLPVGVNFLVAFICYKIIKKVTLSKINKLNKNFECEITLEVNGIRKKFMAFVDSGNTLIDAKTNLPVLVCESVVIDELFNGKSASRFMPITTASGIGDLALYDIDSVTISINGTTRVFDAVLGFSNKSNKLCQSAEIIIGAFFL